MIFFSFQEKTFEKTETGRTCSTPISALVEDEDIFEDCTECDG